MTESKNDFDVAKAIFEELKGIEKERQHRILRWVAESLGLSLSVKPHTAGELAASRLEGQGATPPSPVGSDMVRTGTTDIKSFVDQKKPKSDVQFATVVAYFYRFQAPDADRRETVTAALLKEAARMAKGGWRLAKPHVTLNNAKNQGYLDSAGRGEFRINSVGENLVAMTLPGEEERKPQSARRRKPRTSRKPARKTNKTSPRTAAKRQR